MEIKVNDVQWNSLSDSEKIDVSKIVTGFFQGASISPDPATPPVQAPMGLIPNPWCKPACDLVQSAATAACAALGNPIAVAACVAAAQAAGDACRNSC